MSYPVERRLSALVSADVAGYSKLIADDEVGTVTTLTSYRDEMEVLASQHNGRVVDSPGDNVLMEFPSATDAEQAALEMQRVLGARNEVRPAEKRLVFRMGVHLGEVLIEGDRIYGDGVNIAARIERLATPGEIAVSATVRDQVLNKVEAAFTDLGEQDLKNIHSPVRVYSVSHEAPTGPTPARSAEDRRAAWIAVLPFDNMSGDPSQDYFADGLTEDIITGLSGFRRLRVVSRTASFRYRGLEKPVGEIAAELGVRFVVEGSVRRSGNRVRVTAQLIDASDLHHIWADRYDEDIDDIFEAQDRITSGIVARIDPAITSAEAARLARLRPDNIEAWGLVQQGWTEFWKFKPAANKAAQEHFQAAVDLDPGYADAHSGLATAHMWDAFLFWVEDRQGSIDLAYKEAKRAIDLDSRSDVGHGMIAFVSLFGLGHLDQAVRHAEVSVGLNPSYAISQIILGSALTYSGDLKRGIEHTDTALALSPGDPAVNWFWGNRALAYLLLGDPEEAVASAKEAIKVRHRYLFGRSVLTAALVDLGRQDEATDQITQILEIDPEWGESRFGQYHFRNPDHRSHFIGNLLAAGMPG